MEATPASLAVLEIRRQTLLALALAGLVAWSAAFVASLVNLKAFSPWTEFLPFVLLVPGVPGWFAWQVPWSLLQFDWKDQVAVPAVAAFREGWQLFPGKGLPRKALAQSGLSAHPASQYYAEDLVVGTVEGFRVELAELRATHNVNGGSSRSRTEVLFQGVLGHVDLGGPAGKQVVWDGEKPVPGWDPAFVEELDRLRRDTVPFRLAWDGRELWMGTTSLIDLWEPPLWTRLDDRRRLEKALTVLSAFEGVVLAFVRQAAASPTPEHTPE